MQRDPNLGRSATAEKALMEFHAERREQLACLRTIIQGALQRDAIEPRLVHMFEKFTIELLGATTELGGKHGKGRFVEKLLIEIDNIKAAIAKQRVALQSAPSASVQYQYQPQTSTSFLYAKLFSLIFFHSLVAANQPVARFGDEVVRARIKFLQQERRQLGHILYIVAAARELKSSDISKLVQWLSTSEGPEEGLTIYILTAVFAAVDPSPDVGVDENLALNSLFSDRELFLSMNRVVNQSNWTSPELKAAVLLQWSLFLLEDRRRDPNLQGDASVVEDEVEGIVRGAVEGDAFKCLSHLTVIARARGSGEDLVDEFSVLEGVRRDEGERVDYVEPEFYPYLLSQLETLVTSLIINMGSILRKIKTREEDVLLSRTHQHVHHRSFSALDPPKPPRNDIEAFFRLIAVIYSEMEPDAGLRFWIDEDGKLLGFLRWAAESRNLGMIIAMYDMLASLSKGPSCSSYAYNFLSGGGQYPMPGATHVSGSCSWQSLFGALEYYATNLPNPRNIQAPVAASRMNLSSLNPGAGLHSSAPQPVSLPPEEILMLRSFLRLLRTVALYSPTARAALQENPSFRAISALLTLVTCSIPLELKASLFETLAAFCSPGGGTTSADNVRQMWIALERAEVLPVRGGSSAPSGSLLSSRFGRTSGGGGGVLFELEQVETVGKTYPATIAFIHLLNSLIHTPGGSLTLETESSTVPENLGAGYRTPGIIPYIRFVIDDVFLKAGSREYLSAPEKWKVCDACLCFLEKCLASYDLSVLQGADFSEFNVANPSAKTVATLTSLVAHPGFEVLTRVLSDVRLRDELFFLAEQGFTAMQKNIGGTHFANKTILRSLRIIHRVLGIQGLFLEGLVPLVNGIDNLPGFGQVSLAARGLNSMDQWLLWRGKIVPQIGLYVNSVDDDEMALLSIQILTALSESPSFNSVPQHMPGLPARKLNTLAVLLEESDCLSNILDGFVRLLGVDAEDEEDPSPDPNGPTSHTHAIRSAILNLLLQNTQHGRPAPNLAHLLLGFEARGASNEVAIEDPKATNSRVSCLHVVLELLGEKVPRLDRSESRSSQANQSPLFLRRPALAEKCYRLVHQLCVHPFTSRATLRYLRTREDFFARQLSVFPIKPPSVRGDEMGEVAYADHSRVLTTCATLTSFLRLRSWILECVALELHVLTDAGQQQRIDRLLEILFGSSESVLMKDVDNLEGALLGHSPGQSLIRVLEILESLILEWHDGVMVQDVQLHFYANINWDACLRTDDSGCQIFDERAILSLLTTVRRQLQQQGSLAAEGVQEQLKRETKYVLQSATVENHRRQIDHAKGAAFESWRRIITVVLAQCFGRLPHDRREGVLFDILQTLPSLIVEPSIAPQTAILLSEVMLSLITKVREDRHHQLILQSTAEDSFTASLPTDRLHVLFKSILECILQKGTTERVRGNLYSALINYIHLVFSPEERAQPSSSSDLPLEGNSSMFASTTHAPSDLGSSFLGRSQLGHADATKRSALEIGTLSIVNTLVDRLIPVICRDAVDGSEVWKTVAFTLLDALIRLSRVEKSHRVLSTIVRQGFLQNFVQSIRDSGRDLQLVLKPDPGKLLEYHGKTKLLTMLFLSIFKFSLRLRSEDVSSHKDSANSARGGPTSRESPVLYPIPMRILQCTTRKRSGFLG